MAYSTGFPVSYNNPYQQYYNGSGYQGMPGQYMMQQPGQNVMGQGQMLTPPTIHAEIVQVESEQAAANYPVGPGMSQMMIAKDDSFIAVKTATANGQSSLTLFEKRPEAPPAPTFDPGDYIRRDELPGLIAQYMVAPGKATQKGKQAANESV